MVSAHEVKEVKLFKNFRRVFLLHRSCDFDVFPDPPEITDPKYGQKHELDGLRAVYVNVFDRFGQLVYQEKEAQGGRG